MAAVGLLTLQLRIHGARSLKDKRQVVRALKDRLKGRFNVSVAETGDFNMIRSSTVAVAAVAGDALQLEQKLRRVEEAAYAQLGADLAESTFEIL